MMFNNLVFLFVVCYASRVYSAPASPVNILPKSLGNSAGGIIPLGGNDGGVGLNTLGNPTNLVNGLTSGALGGAVGGATGSAAVGTTVGGAVQEGTGLLGEATGIVKGITGTGGGSLLG